MITGRVFLGLSSIRVPSSSSAFIYAMTVVNPSCYFPSKGESFEAKCYLDSVRLARALGSERVCTVQEDMATCQLSEGPRVLGYRGIRTVMAETRCRARYLLR